jgi:hypothetical protein
MSDEIQRGGKRTRKIPAPAKTALPMDQPKTPSAEAPTVSSEPAQKAKQADMAKLTPEEAKKKGSELLRNIFFRSGPLPMAPDQEPGK